MAAPTTYPITIAIDGVDVTSYSTLDGMVLEDHARQVSTFRVTLKNPSAVLTLARLQTVVITETTGSTVIFKGYVSEFKERKRGIELFYDLDCQDQKMRLQKSIVSGEFSGLDSDILSSLLSSTYPDLSDLFDFSSGITSFADDLALNLEDANLLDALNQLADMADADWRIETGSTAPADITYVVQREGNATTIVNQVISETGPGNPDTGNAAQLTEDSEAATSDFRFEVEVTLPSSQSVTRVTFDGQATATVAETTVWLQVANDAGSSKAIFEDLTGNGAGWLSLDSDVDGTGMPFTDTVVRITVTIPSSAAKTDIDYRIDNIVIYADETYTIDFDSKEVLQWDDTADAADYDIDVQSSDEYAFDIDLTIGDLDDFNSVTVVGGNEEVAIDWVYDNDGTRDHIDLETKVKDIVVYTNGGTDTTPSWGSALTDGVWGTDTLTGDGGSADVLYDDTDHWLLFNTAPPNLTNSFRITGTITRPIRIRVEDAGSDPVLATTYHDESITTIDQAVAAGQGELDKRNGITRLSFKTHHPGLKAGQAFTVADTDRSLSATLTIQRITIEWLGASGHATFKVECGAQEFTGADTIIANNDKRSRKALNATAPSTQTAQLLTTDSLALTSGGTQLFSLA